VGEDGDEAVVGEEVEEAEMAVPAAVVEGEGAAITIETRDAPLLAEEQSMAPQREMAFIVAFT